MNVSEAGGAEEPVTAVKKTSSNKNKNKKY
jgi:hypothetical protein